MKILIIGSGGREHALAHAYSKNKKVKKIIVAPGNDFMIDKKRRIETRPDVASLDFPKIIKLAKQEKPDLIDVAQDDPIAGGLVNILQKEGFLVFGPSKKSSEIEWNKDWSRKFMQKYHLPIPRYKSFSDSKKAISYIQSLSEQALFIKASGLAAGKGALKAENKRQAVDAVVAMRLFGKAGNTFLIEECMVGEEFSLFAICDGTHYKILNIAQDHKTVNNKDEGANTGGMGCVAPTTSLSPKLVSEVEKKILKPFMQGMIKEKRSYIGILYVGGMITKKGIQIVEFNARWGDPEAQIILPSIQSDYLSLVLSVLKKQLDKTAVTVDTKIRVSISGCAFGYPGDIKDVAGKKVFGLISASKTPHTIIYGAGMKKVGKHFTVNGGRLFHIVGEGKSIADARKNALAAISEVYVEGNNLHYRTDIGWRELERNI